MEIAFLHQYSSANMLFQCGSIDLSPLQITTKTSMSTMPRAGASAGMIENPGNPNSFLAPA
jgi:hypothetical protein